MAATRNFFGEFFAETRVGAVTSFGSLFIVETGGLDPITGAIADDYAAFDDQVAGNATQALSASRTIDFMGTFVVEFRNYTIPYNGQFYASNAAFVITGAIADTFGEFVDDVHALQALTKGTQITEGNDTMTGGWGEFVEAMTGTATQSEEKVFTFVGG